jgi:cephalosporin hydroxylase
MPNHDDHVKVLDKKITELSDALAHLGRGTDLKELLRIIRFPGWTTPAEFAFVLAILDSMQTHAKALSGLNTQLLAAGKLVAAKA